MSQGGSLREANKYFELNEYQHVKFVGCRYSSTQRGIYTIKMLILEKKK